ncbi:ADP-ribosylglycohydrolase family protein [Paenibacillus sp. J5C_2022]|uniref:ADP-ribosylglycohydrolase family protein n=1 Tax=Paenibacillus sp. J5C2022 TaxID=2977129 RepID=UPI0021D0442A|nr:ADP-ribosylglycohydrolase family protein [Paenibacillus sp. J5C2022]MCU6709701.1 ADP-ribosylglycohydrolase family protein [Paenibacillus sp. J5C2022]
MNILNEQDYYRIVYGGWLGKNIGGTLGAPVEGVKELLTLTFYPELPDGPLENDDLDLQLVWLHALEQYGPGLTARELGQEWLDHIFFPFDEYGYALTNLRRGLIPPVAGSFNNPFTHCMGSPIRSEIWAMVAPGLPEKAASYAYQDAIVDHAGGEGVFGEMFFAAIESAIFFEKDRDRLIDIGMKFIPTHSRTYKALQDLIRWHQEGKDWTVARSLILEHHGSDNFTDAPQNIAFTILGWLYGNDFEDALLKAVNCGYDTDCTAATLGAILGMLLGPEGLPGKWVKPVGDRVVVSPPINGFPAPKNLDELTLRTIRIGKQVLAASEVDIRVHPNEPSCWDRQVFSLQGVKELWERSATSNHYLLPRGTSQNPTLELIIDYGAEGPAIGPNQTKTIQVTLLNRAPSAITGKLSLDLPEGWVGPDALAVIVQSNETVEWTVDITASASAEAYHELALLWTRIHDHSVWAMERVTFTLIGSSRWTVWGPESSEGIKVMFPGNRLDWEKIMDTDVDGCYRAVTSLYNPSDRQVRLIAAANAPILLKLNGKIIIDCKQAPEFMPAYHRAPNDQWIELTLAAGSYELDVSAWKNGVPLQVYILPVAIMKTTDPGPCYYYTDMLFGGIE